MLSEVRTYGVVWSGQWVTDRLGVALDGGPELRQLLGLAVRDNPRRAHLLVSTVLGKHVPQRPAEVYGAGLRLGRRVRDLLGEEAAARAVVVGYAETATGLGHSVADGLGHAPYLHSTRRPVPGVAPAGGFEEEHSHATSHLLLPEDPGLLGGDGPLVLVDDEFSTGTTVLNTIADLHRRHPRDRYVVVALVDTRSPRDRDRLAARAAALGARVDLVALATGTVRLPEGVLERGQELVARYAPEAAAVADSPPGGVLEATRPVRRVDLGWPEGLPDGGRHGFTPAHRARLEAALPAMAARVAEALAPGAPGGTAGTEPAARRVLVLGCEELMYAPLRIAEALDAAVGAEVRYSTTTRSPVLAVDDPGYAIRTRLVFPAHDAPADGPGERYAYNVAPGADPARRFDAVVAVVDSAADTLELHAPGGLLARLAAHTDRVLLAVVPSYAPSALPGGPGAAAAHAAGPPAQAPRAAGPRAVAPISAGPRAVAPDAVRPGAAVPASTTPPAPPVPPAPPPRAVPEAAGPEHPAPPPRVPAAARPSGPAVPSGPADPALPDPAPDRQAPRMPAPLPAPLRGPGFSSYVPDEVGWLLQDLSDVALEAPTEEREEAIQSGGAHYAESLPVEYQPSEEYQRLFRAALETSAARIARAVGAVTETVLAERSPRPVLVSLARAGTPVGVLMRRWARHARGLDLPHYAISIVRGRGVDTVALRWLAAHHDPADVVFVDGWTGKGAITHELAAGLRPYEGFDPRIAVLADPGRCVDTYGTRDDFLIPSACLNSTVSGLVSRTVLRADLVGPDDFHGAKFYRELAGADVSGLFLDTVEARFAEVGDAVAADVKELAAADRTPTWEGWAAVERISEAYGIHDVNLVKPGVGETTRVLLRRVPWRILARRGAGSDLDHVRLLAEQRGVPVEETDDLPYSCVGLIHPRYTRGATGADGRAVTAR
ncbi:phosphoribosyltransferase [Streptomyces sp. B1866]|uniref:phosphoribosyltransferase n=1 Tax=Streptomyces sp. B1866 TaxID=3075431 RepID=UPI00289149BA|nr:phosphoribosyltransferase [Streptomyces sp. B1866]MDT3398022.1 phosphoribosyltransferase [Streptomyces sp. B1866]